MWMHKQPSMPGGCEKYLLCPGTSFDQRISNIGELKVWHAVQFHALSTSSELRRQWPFDLFIPHQYQKLIQKRNDQAQGEIWDKNLKVKILQATKPFKVFQSHQKNHPCYCWFVERSPVLQRGVSWFGGLAAFEWNPRQFALHLIFLPRNGLSLNPGQTILPLHKIKKFKTLGQI